MNGRVMEIVNQIVRSVVSLDGIDRIERELSAKFRKKGYKFTEIRQAFSYIFRMLKTAGEHSFPSERPVRILSHEESLHLTSGARSMILRLYYCADIGHYDLERVLEYVTAQDRVLSEHDISVLLEGSVQRKDMVEN